MSVQTLRTADEARAWLERHGVSVSEWARAHGFAPTVVFSVLSGRTRGRRGQAHEVAVALKLKESASPTEASPLGEAHSAAATKRRGSMATTEERRPTMT